MPCHFENEMNGQKAAAKRERKLIALLEQSTRLGHKEIKNALWYY